MCIQKGNFEVLNKRTMLGHGDCLELMKEIPDNSIDCCITDPPYGTTACKWDIAVPFDLMWKELKRIVKDNRAICLFGSEPFSSALRMSNIENFKYDWVWNKSLAGNGIVAKIQPLKIHELVHIFSSKRKCIYNPQMTKGKMRNKMTSGIKVSEINRGDRIKKVSQKKNDLYYPKSILEFSTGNMREGRFHPTQKPVALLEYLIKTYTLENEIILDFTMGSGSTGVAAANLKRQFIGFEKEEKYFNIACERITTYDGLLN